MGPGDTAFVDNGSYLGFDVDGVHGSSGANITIKALPGASAVVTVTTDRSDNRDTIYVCSSSYIVLEGLRSFYANRAAMRVSQSDHIAARNCTFGNNAVWGIFTDFSYDLLVEGCDLFGSGSQHGVYFSNSGDRPTARNNTIHDNSGCGIHMNGDASMGGDGLITGALVEGNVIYNNGRSGGGGINMDGVQSSVVQNNILYNNHASGIVNFKGDGSSGPMLNEFYHNSVDMASDARWALQISDSVGTVKVRNNILYDRNPGRGGLALGSATDVANVDSDYNIMDRVTPDGWNTVLTLAQWQAQGHEAHSFSATPASLFVNDAAADYHLKDGSPAIDKGQSLPYVTSDKEGKGRPVGNCSDIGAYEWGTPVPPDTTPPAAIMDLAITNVTLTTMELNWTAPGNNGTAGTAFSYDLRYQRGNAGVFDWKNATRVSGVPAPLPAGTREGCRVPNLLPGTDYYFAMSAKDKSNNTSPLSNLVMATTLRLVPDIYMSQADLTFSDDAPMEGDIIFVTAAFHSVNLTRVVNLTVGMLVDDLTAAQRTLVFNTTTGGAAFDWTAGAGNHTITIQLDPNNTIEETDRTNNNATRTIRVKERPPPPLPDLFIAPSDMSFSKETPVEGETVNITALVHSAGLERNASVEVALLVDDNLTAARGVVFNGSSVAGAGFNWTAAGGKHRMAVAIDRGNGIAEADESNNAAMKWITVALPDLSIAPSDISVPAKSPMEGTVLDLTATVHSVNLTREAAVTVELQVDGVAVDERTVLLNATTVPVRFCWTAKIGEHDLTIRVDSKDILKEDNEANNAATVHLSVRERPATPRLDLWLGPGDIVFSAVRPSERQNVTITATVHVANLTQGTDIRVDMLVDGIAAGSISGALAVPATSKAVQFNWTAVKGSHNITIGVSALGGVVEADQTNNNASRELSVLKAPGPHAEGMSAFTVVGIGIILIAIAAAVSAAVRSSRRKGG